MTFLDVYVRHYAGAIGDAFVLQDNNAILPYRARILDAYFEQEAIQCMQWPARSPDLNPIEHLLILLAELPEKSTLYKAGENAIATGWGHSGVVHKFEDVEGVPEDQLKEILLPIQSMDKCNETIKNNNLRQNVFTERMFCAGDGGGGNDTCKGDSGGPLMQSQMNEKEGHKYWTQIGVISWGIGCGLANTYGYYTHVQKLHDWVMSIIQSAE
ncbi:suppressor of tumorigenicity 14 [Trichonephila clavipes]|nr:suppressor of tumorigenicity 14 [Trichonephila clavipes]